MKVGEQRFISSVWLRATFHDRLAIDGRWRNTPEDAFLASLIGGTVGHYTLRERQYRYGYVLSREDQPSWQDRRSIADGS
jgi:hypothetical protein